MSLLCCQWLRTDLFFLCACGWGLAGLRAFGAVLGAALVAAVDSGGVECTADEVVAYAREVLDASTADEYDGVLLEVVAFAGDVGVDFLAVGEADAGDFTHCGVRLLRRGGVDTHADATALWA